jgi:predicted RNA-binding Zn-ribbon protein involved in translation (DUF1610 family)
LPSLITCPDCGKEISQRAAACPNCGAPISANTASDNVTSGAMVCHTCKQTMIYREKKATVSLAGILGALLFIVGLPCLFLSPILGIALIIVGILTGIMGRGTRSFMVCPQCGFEKSIPK